MRQLADQHPEWQTTEPFASALTGDLAAALTAGGHDQVYANLAQLIAATHGNLSSEAFAAAVRDWLKNDRHPSTGKPFNQMVYQPMLELLHYLRQHNFKTYIVSGGGIDLMRIFSQETYGIPPEQVVGSNLHAKYEVIDGTPTIVKLPDISFIDDKAGKPVGITNTLAVDQFLPPAILMATFK